jgi:heme a synthase
MARPDNTCKIEDATVLLDFVGTKPPLLKTASAREQIRWMALRLAGATWILMMIGSATRVMNAGLACPDWPLCYGTLFPSQQMNLQVFLEWFHRLDAAIVGFGLVVLTAWGWYRARELPRWVPWVTTGSLGLVIVQGLLGALTVTQLLRFDMVTAHLGTALLLFSVLVGIAVALQPYRAMGTAMNPRWVATVTTTLIYTQSLLGGLVASQWALHQCLAGSQLCGVLNSHILGVVPATIGVLSLGWISWRTPALSPQLRQLAGVACCLLVAQTGLGLAALKLRLQVEPITVAHQTLGAALLGTLLAFSILAWRDRLPRPSST